MFALPASLGIVGPKVSSLAIGQIFTAVSSGTSAYTVAIWERSGDSISVVDNISTGGRGLTGQMDISDTGVYLAKVNNITGGAGSLQLYKKTSGVWAEITAPVISTVSGGVAFSPSANYLAVGCNAAPRLRIYKRSGDSFATECTIVTAPANNMFECVFTPSGNHLFGGVATNPYVQGWSKSGDTFTRIANPTSLTGGQVNGIDVNPAGDCIVVAHNSANYFKAYYFNGTTLANLATITGGYPGGTGNRVKFSADGAWCAVAHESGDYLTIYAVTGSGSGTSFTKHTYSNKPPLACTSVDFDSTSTYCAVCHAASGGVTMTLYKLVSGTWTRVQQTDLTSPGSVGPTALIWDVDR